MQTPIDAFFVGNLLYLLCHFVDIDTHADALALRLSKSTAVLGTPNRSEYLTVHTRRSVRMMSYRSLRAVCRICLVRHMSCRWFSTCIKRSEYVLPTVVDSRRIVRVLPYKSLSTPAEVFGISLTDNDLENVLQPLKRSEYVLQIVIDTSRSVRNMSYR